jgi:hypothetical protein
MKKKLIAVWMLFLMVASSFVVAGAGVMDTGAWVKSEPIEKFKDSANGVEIEAKKDLEPYTPLEEEEPGAVESSNFVAPSRTDWSDAYHYPDNAAEIASQKNDEKNRIFVVSDETHVVIALSDETHVVIALGDNATGYKRFPVAKPNGTEGLVSGQAEKITGQLVDGHKENITSIESGGLTGNHGIGGSGPGETISVDWTLKDKTGTTLAQGSEFVQYNDGSPGNPAINGTFRIGQVIPVLKPAGEAVFEFCFAGWGSAPLGGKIYPANGDPPGSCDQYPVFIQHPVDLTLAVNPEPANAGEEISVSGTMKDDDGFPVAQEGVVVSYEQPKGAYITIGEEMPAGWFIDDVVVTADGNQIFTDNFEEGFELNDWNTGGTKDEWEAGVPAAPDGPVSAHTPIRCAGTDLDDSYEIQTDSFLITANLNLSASSSATISFWHWLDIADNDYVVVEASADSGGYWVPISSTIASSSTTWDSKSLDLTSRPDPRDPDEDISFVGSETVKIRFRIVSKGFSVYTDDDGEFQFNYILPPDSLPARHQMRVDHPQTSLYLAGFANISIRVRRVTHFEFMEDNSTKVGYRSKWVEIRAKLVDNMGEIPDNNIEGLPQSYLIRVFWDPTLNDPSDNPIPVDQKTITLGSVNESRNGWVIVSYLVPLSQALGYVGIIFKYDGSDFYKAVEQQDTYMVKAHTQINAPPPEELRFYRGEHINLEGTLVIVPSESQQNPTGDPVPFKDIKIWWRDKELTKATTDLQGRFSREHFIGGSHSLGAVTIRFVFGGDFPYEPVDVSINVTVVSRTYIEFRSDTGFMVKKGTTMVIKGSIADDLGSYIPELPIIIKSKILGSENTLGRATSGLDGSFEFTYKIPFEHKVGNLTILAQFDGTDKYEPSTNETNYAIVIDTTIVRVDDTFEVIRGEQMEIQGLLYEDWDGTLGYMVPFEQVTINLGRIPLTTVLTDIDGNFSIDSFVPDTIDVGKVDVELMYNGSRFYTESSNTTSIYIRSHTIMKFQNVVPNETLMQSQPLAGEVLLTDDLQNPLKNETIKIYWVEEGEDPLAMASDPQREIFINKTDRNGRIYFNVTFHDGVREESKQVKNRTFVAFYDGRRVNTTYGVSTEILIHSSANKTIDYVIPRIQPIPPTLWIMAIIIICVVCVVVGYMFYEMNKRRALKGMQTIIRKAADQLVAGNEYAAVIFKAYRKLAATMKRYGYMRRDSETFREFEGAIREALPIDANAMDDFIDVLEEARYSSHEMGEPDRDRAIEALRKVQFSLDRIVLSEAQMAQIQARATEISAADEAEPVIIVDKGVGLKRKGGAAPPSKPGGPPKPMPKPGAPPKAEAKPGPTPPEKAEAPPKPAEAPDKPGDKPEPDKDQEVMK